MDYTAQARQVIETEIAALSKLRDALDAAFADAVRRLQAALDAGGKIVVTGVGKSYHVACKIAATFSSTGATAVTLNPAQALHGDIGLLAPRDAVLVISYSGASDELVALLPLIKREGLPLIAVTGQADSALGKAADTVILAAVDREACPFNMAPTASTTAAMAVGDALAMVLLEARGFKREDYARLHPAGAIGRALLLRVSDIMRTGDRLARVPRTARVRDAVLAMTRARAGSAAVVDEQGRVLGIFTDGDLRRHLMESGAILDKPVASVMTPSPVTVPAGRLAADVLHVFEEHKIDDILVVDGRGVLAGSIDIQDLPRLKIL
ncbi:MAG: KpsF/GutQ family sugar-phosphate isomerase [Lentisphaerae bacterium]|nr:KpsF/GutQ family sugar-phosphate isomerase [Lentisphaerota bacterium]